MKTFSIAAAIGIALTFPAPALRAQAQPATDTIYRRAQRLVSDGSGEAGRAIVDSMLRSAAAGSAELAEALFWRATFAASADDSERDYRRIVVEHPLYFRAGDALLRLAQMELARGNQDAALVHLRRIALEHPGGSNRALASYWTARALLEKNDTSGACSAVRDARARLNAADVELQNQIDYLGQQCALPATNAAADTGPPVTPPTAVPAPANEATGEQPADAPAGPFSVQVAAYNTGAEAKAAARRLVARGYAARVDGTVKPFRVRVGRYATRALAAAAQQRMKAKGVTGYVVRTDGK